MSAGQEGEGETAVYPQSINATNSYLPILYHAWDPLSRACSQPSNPGLVEGELKTWHPITVNFSGPFAAETDITPNPFLDYRLWVLFSGPSGQTYRVPGFFAADGEGGSEGNRWQVRFSPDESGEWSYCASFRSGTDVAISLKVQEGTTTHFDGAFGQFSVQDDPDAPGFLKWGRLEHVQAHYLKFREGPYWIKGGTNSPENLLGYLGFENTSDQGGLISGFLHQYASHIADWQPGDPNFSNFEVRYDGKGLIGALNYLAAQHVNSVYFLPMNLGGDGQDTYPFVGPSGSTYDNTHYDVSKLDQWNIVFEHAQRKGIALHVVLNEVEQDNRLWLDNGALGRERKLFYREMIARFGHILALKWNLSEENVFTLPEINAFTDYLQALDWSRHPLTLHTPLDDFRMYEQIVGDPRFATTSIQYRERDANDHVEMWRVRSAQQGWPWVIDMDENSPAGTGLTPDNADELRQHILYDVYFSGGNIEWYLGYHELPLGGDIRLEDFRTREAMWRYMWYARRFMQENLPFWEMEPADELLVGESLAEGAGQVFAKPNEIYAIYLPNASPSGDLIVANSAAFTRQWYDPRTGEFVGETQTVVPNGNRLRLGTPPANPDTDWVVLLKRVNSQ
ncbi:MAG: DUF5060 domain-containing protein [Chloroflexota bacterium]